MSPLNTKNFKIMRVNTDLQRITISSTWDEKWDWRLIKMNLNVFICLTVSITFSTKIFTLAIASFLLISFGIPYEFAMVPYVYLLLTPLEKEVHSSSSEYRHAPLAAHSSKRFKPSTAIILLCLCNTPKQHDFKIISLLLVLLV